MAVTLVKLCLVVLLPFLFAPAFCYPVQNLSKTEAYSETVSNDREHVAASQTQFRLLVETGAPVDIYGTVGFDIASRPHAYTSAAEYSHTYAGAGLQGRLFSFLARSEVRNEIFFQESPARSSQALWNLRNELIYGDVFSERSTLATQTWFADVYIAALHSTRHKNLITTAQTKLGRRLYYAAPFAFDIYAEPYFSADKRGDFYNNIIEERNTVRAVLAGQSYTATLSYAVSAFRYLPHNRDGRPKKNSGWYQRVLFTIGGTFF